MKKINICFLSDEHLEILNNDGVYLDEQDLIAVGAENIENLDLLKKIIRIMTENPNNSLKEKLQMIVDFTKKDEVSIAGPDWGTWN